MQERHVDDLLEAYALGALEPTEVDFVERHLEHCASCRALAEQLRRLADVLLTVVPQVAPPPALRARVLDRVARERGAARPNHTRQVHSQEQQPWSLGR